MQPAGWIPLVGKFEPFDADKAADKQKEKQQKQIETFVDNSQSVSIVETIFIIIAFMALASAIAMLFYWSYQKDESIFIIIFAVIAFAYTLSNVIYISINRSSMGSAAFKYYLGTGVFISLMEIFVIIFFAFKAARGSSSGSTGYRSLPQVPDAPQY